MSPDYKYELGDEVVFRGRPAVIITWPTKSLATGHVVYGVRFVDVPGSAEIAREDELERAS